MTTATAPTRPPAATLWRPGPRRLARLLIGLTTFGVGDAFIVSSVLGNAPWTVLAQGVSLHTPLTLGIATQVIGLLVLAGWIPLRERPGLGTVLNVVVIGIAIDLTLLLLATPGTVAARALFLLLGIALVGAGSGLYLGARLGPGPRDGLMTGIARRAGWPLAAVRGGIEISVLAAGWALGGTVGVGTLVFAVLIGPAVGIAVRMLPARPVPATGAPRA